MPVMNTYTKQCTQVSISRVRLQAIEREAALTQAASPDVAGAKKASYPAAVHFATGGQCDACCGLGWEECRNTTTDPERRLCQCSWIR